MNVKTTFSIDIVDDILIRPDALDIYLGEEVNTFLIEKLSSFTEPTLLKLDLSKANPIDYLFAKAAFCSFYKKIKEDERFDAIFYVKKSQVKSLFWGLLACIDGNIHRTGDYESDFIGSSNIKICLIGEQIQFKGTLSLHEVEILRCVNEQGVMDENAIYDAFKQTISNEKITDAIRALRDRKFIYWDEKSMPNMIYSIMSKI